MDLKRKYQEKYKDLDLEDASGEYYGTGNAMNRVLAGLQEGIDKAVVEFETIKGKYEDPHVNINICQDEYEITFSIAKYDEDEYEYIDGVLFYRHLVGEPMAEALVLMQMMEDSGISTGISQATNNWVEDLNFAGFGEFDSDYSVSDNWGFVEY